MQQAIDFVINIPQVWQMLIFVEDFIHLFTLKFFTMCQEKAFDSLKKSAIEPTERPRFHPKITYLLD